jgi:hypothetical protein
VCWHVRNEARKQHCTYTSPPGNDCYGRRRVYFRQIRSICRRLIHMKAPVLWLWDSPRTLLPPYVYLYVWPYVRSRRQPRWIKGAHVRWFSHGTVPTQGAAVGGQNLWPRVQSGIQQLYTSFIFFNLHVQYSSISWSIEPSIGGKMKKKLNNGFFVERLSLH